MALRSLRSYHEEPDRAPIKRSPLLKTDLAAICSLPRPKVTSYMIGVGIDRDTRWILHYQYPRVLCDTLDELGDLAPGIRTACGEALLRTWNTLPRPTSLRGQTKTLTKFLAILLYAVLFIVPFIIAASIQCSYFMLAYLILIPFGLTLARWLAVTSEAGRGPSATILLKAAEDAAEDVQDVCRCAGVQARLKPAHEMLESDFALCTQPGFVCWWRLEVAEDKTTAEEVWKEVDEFESSLPSLNVHALILHNHDGRMILSAYNHEILPIFEQHGLVSRMKMVK